MAGCHCKNMVFSKKLYKTFVHENQSLSVQNYYLCMDDNKDIFPFFPLPLQGVRQIVDPGREALVYGMFFRFTAIGLLASKRECGYQII